MDTLVEYVITATDRATGEIIDAEEVRGYGRAQSVFDARVEQWNDEIVLLGCAPSVTIKMVNDKGTLVRAAIADGMSDD